MISKELLSEVLNKDVKKCMFDLETIHYNIRSDVKEHDFVAFYDLCWHVLNEFQIANKCKKWAYNKDYYIYSIVTFDDSGVCYVTQQNNIQRRLRTFDADTEPAAIFEACEWIKDETKRT